MSTIVETDQKRILWADDEIDLLRPHIIFLTERGYDVEPVTNGDDAIQQVKKQGVDVVLLDEMMPGRDGLSTLAAIKDINPHIPVIMITKNEEERLMEEALGQRSSVPDFNLRNYRVLRRGGFCCRGRRG